MAKEMSKFEIGMDLVRDYGNGVKDTAKVIAADNFQYGGQNYKSIGACAEAMARKHGAKDDVKLSGWQYFGVENPNPGQRGARTVTVEQNSIVNLLKSPEQLMAEAEAEYKARMEMLRNATANRRKSLTDTLARRKADFDAYVKQAAQAEDDVNKLTAALESMGPEENTPPASDATQPQAPASDDNTKTGRKGKNK